MKIAVCLKYVPDLDSVDVDPITGVVDESRLLYVINPADEGALELALRLAADEGEVEVFTVGGKRCEDALRSALGAGAQAVTRLWDGGQPGCAPFYTAGMLAAAIKGTIKEGALPDLVLCGTRSDDNGSGLVPALLAEHLGWPVVVDVTQFEIKDGEAMVQRRVTRGAREEVIVPLPAVLALEPDLARLRHATLFGLMAAQRATIPVLNSTQLGIAPPERNCGLYSLSRRVANSPKGHRMKEIRNLFAIAPKSEASEGRVLASLPPEIRNSPLPPTIPTPAPVARPPRPRTRAIFTPNSALPAHERAQQIISAGVTRDSGRILEGPPHKMAEAIVEVLAQRGLIC